jgi:YhcN/YlaJ family sporulation lipoprotein
MKWKTLIATVTLSTLFITACGTNNNNANETASRNPNQNEFRNVNYTPNGFNEFTEMGNDNIHPIVDQNTNYNMTNRNNNQINQNNTRIAVADDAAKKIVDLREVDQANVLVTDNNAYVAAKLEVNAGNKLERNVEKKISDLVKSTDRNIDNVYVSVNPDFYTRTTSYANDIRNGHPVAGFSDEFNTLIQRIFPTRR